MIMKPHRASVMNPFHCFLLLGAMLLVLPRTHEVLAQSSSRPQGFVDLERLGDLDAFFDEDPVVEVNVEGGLMKLVAAASRSEDPELADLLLGLSGVYVRGYVLEPNSLNDFDQRASRMGERLVDDGWVVVVRFREVDEVVHMYVRMSGDNVDGMVVMSVEPGQQQAMFVNIVGNIDPEQIGRIGQKFRIPGMDRQ